MAYKDSKELPLKGDKVLGDKVKGHVDAVKADGVVVVKTKGAWDPETAITGPDEYAEHDPATLLLVSRAPEKKKAKK